MNNNLDIEYTFNENEILLSPPTGVLEEAKKIAVNTKADESFLFALLYDVNNKEFLLSILQTLGINILSDDEEQHILHIKMNMTQLSFIKLLHCVERVSTAEESNPLFSKKENMFSVFFKGHDDQQNTENDIVGEQDFPKEAMKTYALPVKAIDTEQIHEDNNSSIIKTSIDTIATHTTSLCYSNCCDNTSMETAIKISVGSHTGGYICCPGASQWFKFTAPKTGQYTIYTTGSLDTIGTLYNCNGVQLVKIDDHTPSGQLNFRIVQNLVAGATYYIKVNVYGNTIGAYTLILTQQVFADSVTINTNSIDILGGVRYELPITPNYTYKGYKGAKCIPELSVSISPANASEQKVFWKEEYGNGILECIYDWDDDGDRYNHVIATSSGSTKLFAEDWNENGRKDSCVVNVKFWPKYQKPSIESRSSWEARTVIEDRLVKRDRNPECIVFHHSAEYFVSSKNRDIKKEIQRIQNMHMGNKEKCDIAYHFIIDPAGGIWEGAEIDDYKRGHADYGMNDIGVVVLGNFEKKEWFKGPNTLNDAQKSALKELAKWLCYEYDLPINEENDIIPIKTHQEVDGDTDCPGINARGWITNDLKDYIRNWHNSNA